MEIIKTDKMFEPDISIIIPVYNEEKYLPYVIESLKYQKTDYKAEVILIDDCSTDNTYKIAEEAGFTVYKNIIDTEGKKLTVTEMRNFGVSKSHGKTIYHMDGDTIFSENFFQNMLDPILKEGFDITLVFKHKPFETKIKKVFPSKYSKSFAFIINNLPSILFLKIPVRFFIWISNWLKKMLKEKKYISIFEIPDRVNGSALLVKRDIAINSGGWKKPFGSHADTDYCLNCFKFAKKVKWITNVTLFYSIRRHFPENDLWIFEKIFSPFINILDKIFKIKSKKHRNEKGYIKPEGKR
ncbi:MAG: glycosyltransferase family 2 protein [Spirochaetes bacterium]|nr:glycosyltransferase family 2 protein [Spirochaetota bacterium]